MKKAGEFDDPLTYKIPDELEGVLNIGNCVKIPLRSQSVNGIVVELNTKLPFDINSSKIKEISEITKLSLSEHQITLAKQIADYYRTSLTRSLRLMMPTAIWKGKLEEPMKTFYRIHDHRRRGSAYAPSKGIRGCKKKKLVQKL